MGVKTAVKSTLFYNNSFDLSFFWKIGPLAFCIDLRGFLKWSGDWILIFILIEIDFDLLEIFWCWDFGQ